MRVRLTAEPISPLTLVDRVYQRLWDWILSGRLEPGDWLRIQELAQTLNVSDTPIREALIRLQQSGLVETIPHVGTRVRRFTRRDIEESFELREALECHALQHAAPRVAVATLERLMQQLKKAEPALEEGNTAPAVAADIELHTTLIRAAGNARILALFSTLLDQIRMFAGFGNRTPEGPRRFLEMHLRLVELLLEGHVASAVRLMREHMQLAKDNSLRGYFGGLEPLTDRDEGEARRRLAAPARGQAGAAVSITPRQQGRARSAPGKLRAPTAASRRGNLRKMEPMGRQSRKEEGNA